MSEGKPLNAPQQKRGCSPWVIAILGCGGVCILLVVAVCGGGAYWIRGVFSGASEFAASFEERGYKRVSGQELDERDEVTSPRVYYAQVVRIHSDVDADLAFAAQVAEIYGTVDGDIDFYGQVLVVKPDAVVKGDVRAKLAQVVQIEGTVEGEVTGTYQTLQRKDSANPGEPSADISGTDGKSTENDDASSDSSESVGPDDAP